MALHVQKKINTDLHQFLNSPQKKRREKHRIVKHIEGIRDKIAEEREALISSAHPTQTTVIKSESNILRTIITTIKDFLRNRFDLFKKEATDEEIHEEIKKAEEKHKEVIKNKPEDEKITPEDDEMTELETY